MVFRTSPDGTLLGEATGDNSCALKLYYEWRSTSTRRVRIVLHEKGLDWEGLHIEKGEEYETYLPWYAKMNPLGVVPTHHGAQGPQLGRPGDRLDIGGMHDEEQARRRSHHPAHAQLPEPGHQQDAREGMKRDVDEVIPERLVAEELPFDSGQEQMHGRVARRVELRGAPGIEQLADRIGIQLLGGHSDTLDQ